MYYNLDNEIAKRATKDVYRDGDKTIKLFVENYSKANILNEALNQARVEETDLNIPKLLEVTKDDQEAIQGIVESQGYIMPNVKMSIYKNRRGSYNRLYLWMNADKGTCRFNPIFATDYQYNPIPMADIEIKIKKGV